MADQPDYTNIDPRSEVNPTDRPYVRLERDGPVAHLVFNRPEKLNAWAWGPTNELCAHADALRFETGVRVIVLRAEGRAFCAGEDLKPDTHGVEDRHYGRSPAERVRNSYERARYLFERWRVVEALPQPVIAGIQGYCLGAGIELAMLADLRVASEDAIFGFPQATLGVPVVGGADMRLAAECGAGVAKLLTLTGRRFDAAEALRIGMLQQVVPREELLAAVTSLAAEIAANAPIAVQGIKRQIDRFTQRGFDEASLFEAMSSSIAFVSDDLYKGFEAAARKERADFEGS